MTHKAQISMVFCFTLVLGSALTHTANAQTIHTNYRPGVYGPVIHRSWRPQQPHAIWTNVPSRRVVSQPLPSQYLGLWKGTRSGAYGAATNYYRLKNDGTYDVYRKHLNGNSSLTPVVRSQLYVYDGRTITFRGKYRPQLVSHDTLVLRDVFDPANVRTWARVSASATPTPRNSGYTHAFYQSTSNGILVYAMKSESVGTFDLVQISKTAPSNSKVSRGLQYRYDRTAGRLTMGSSTFRVVRVTTSGMVLRDAMGRTHVLTKVRV